MKRFLKKIWIESYSDKMCLWGKGEEDEEKEEEEEEENEKETLTGRSVAFKYCTSGVD